MAAPRAVSPAEVADLIESGDVDWYVEMNGLPVGPVPMNLLHARAEAGVVTADSLAWREGLEDWQPLREFPELLAIVEEARAGAGPVELVRPLPGTDAATLRDDTAATSLASVATPEDAGPAAAGLGLARTPRGAWIAVLAALLLGLAIGFAIFGGPAPTRTIFKYVERRTATKLLSPVASSGEQPDKLAESPASVRQPRARRRSKVDSEASARADGIGQSQDRGGTLPGLQDLAGLPGGTERPIGLTKSPPRAEPLDPAQVQHTVARYSGSVKRGCWQPALGARDRDAPPTARVSVSIQVAPGGNVQSASTSGDPRGYPGLASCIASRVRSWQFPRSGGSTTVNIPFVFAAQ